MPDMLAALLPLRDARDRVVAYELSSHPDTDDRGTATLPQDARATLDLVRTLPLIRMAAGRSVHVPITPELLREGALARFASLDAVFVLATSALDDGPTRRAAEVLAGKGFRIGLDGFPEGDTLPSLLRHTTVAIDAGRLPPLGLASRVQLMLETGLRPIARGVDDRAVRERVVALGVTMYGGRTLPRGKSADVEAEAGLLRAVSMLAAFSDGRPPDSSFDAFVRDDPRVSAALLQAVKSAAVGVRGVRTIEHALTVLGRDAVLAQITVLASRLAADCGGDQELAIIALRRARLCERLGMALERVSHPRARMVAGLLSVLDCVTGTPAPLLASRLNLPPLLQDVLGARRQPLGQLVDLVDAYENGWWSDLRARCKALGVAPSVVRTNYFEAWRAARDELGTARVSDATRP